MIKFNLDVLNPVHGDYDSVELFPNQRNLGKLAGRLDLTATIYIDDEVLVEGLFINKLIYSRFMEKARDAETKSGYKVRVEFKFGEEVVAESWPLQMVSQPEGLSLMSARTNTITAGLAFFKRFCTAMELLYPIYVEREYPEPLTRLFGFQLGPNFMELYWDRASENFAFGICPVNNIENIRMIPLSANGRDVFARSLLPVLKEYEDWIFSTGFRTGLIEEPVGDDLSHHYTFLRALATASNPAEDMPISCRWMESVMRNVD